MYDVVIIGGGPGGYAAAIRASQLKGKVALVEAADIGGTCVNRGCIPSKTWLHSAELLDRIRHADTFGIHATIDELKLSAVVERITGVAGDIRMGMEGLLGYNQVKVIRGRAVLRNARNIDVDGTAIETRRIIIATGSRIDMPYVPGLEDVVTTTDRILEMKSVPKSILVWGAGPIEVEMATLLNRFGAKVTLAMEGRRILEGEDRDTSQRVAQAIRTEGVEIIPKHQLTAVKKSKNGLTCELSSGSENRTLEVASVLVGARKPNTSHMGLEQAGIDLDDDGSIHVNERLGTSKDGVYAIGDATGGRMLSHTASTMGITAAENAMGKPAKFPFHSVPRGIWTSPEIGAVGLTEEEAEEQGYEIEVGDFPYTINGLAMVRDQLGGAVKIVSDAQYGKILGVHIIGARATELVGEAVLAMELEATVREFAKSIRVHPTFSETLVEASRDAANWALYLQNR